MSEYLKEVGKDGRLNLYGTPRRVVGGQNVLFSRACVSLSSVIPAYVRAGWASDSSGLCTVVALRVAAGRLVRPRGRCDYFRPRAYPFIVISRVCTSAGVMSIGCLRVAFGRARTLR